MENWILTIKTSTSRSRSSVSTFNYRDSILFSVLGNACATQAIVNLLLNLDSSQVTLGSVLDNFHSFSKELDPQTRGLCLSNSQEIRTVHNSFARPNFLEIEHGKGSKEDAYHFVTYVPFKGHVYELDGLKEAPIDLGAIPEGKDWLEVIHGVLETRVRRFAWIYYDQYI